MVGIIKADDKWKGRWYGIMRKEGAKNTYNWGSITLKERNIPRLSNRPELMRVGMDLYFLSKNNNIFIYILKFYRILY